MATLLGVPSGLNSPPAHIYRFQYQGFARPVQFTKDVTHVVLNAKEVNSDIALFAINVFKSNPAVSAEIGVVEVPWNSGGPNASEIAVVEAITVTPPDTRVFLLGSDGDQLLGSDGDDLLGLTS